MQLNTQQVGPLPSPMQPANVTGELDLTQSLAGPADNGTAATRGYTPVSSGVPNFTNSSQARAFSALQQPFCSPLQQGCCAICVAIITVDRLCGCMHMCWILMYCSDGAAYLSS